MGLPERVGWSDLLRNYLEKEDSYYSEVYALGVDRDTSSDLVKRMENEARARKADVIIIEVGINDSLMFNRNGTHVANASEAEFERNINELISIARKLTKEVIFIGLFIGDEKLTNPLPRSITGKCFTKKRAEEFNAIIKKVCRTHKVAFVDMIEDMQNADFHDGLHPNQKGHEKIFNQIIALRGNWLTMDVNVVNENDEIIGHKTRSDLTPSDIYQVSVLKIQNNKKEVLLSQRSLAKSHEPGVWGPAVAATVEKRQNYMTTVRNAAQENLGLLEIIITDEKKIKNTKEYNHFSKIFTTTINQPVEHI